MRPHPISIFSLPTAAIAKAKGPVMTALRFIEIDGKRYLWRELVRLRREQRATMQPQALAEGGAPALDRVT
jgi:hypothetical protein